MRRKEECVSFGSTGGTRQRQHCPTVNVGEPNAYLHNNTHYYPVNPFEYYTIYYSILIMPKQTSNPSTKRLCACKCGRYVTRKTEANHLSGKHAPARVKLARAEDAIKQAAKAAKRKAKASVHCGLLAGKVSLTCTRTRHLPVPASAGTGKCR
jgi:hypothetical protein